MGRVLGVIWVCWFCFIFWGMLFFASILKKKVWGVFWACSGHVVFALIFYKKSGACSGRVPGVLFLLYYFEKTWGVFWACCFCFNFLKKIWGVFRACSLCSTVFTVFHCVHCVVSTDPFKVLKSKQKKL